MEWERLTHAVIKTPVWVWGIIVYLIYVGVRAMRPQTIYPPALFAVPLVLTCFNFPVFFGKMPYLYIGMLALGGVTGALIGTNMHLVISQNRRLTIPGSILPLVIFSTFICTKYIYGLLKALCPDIALSWSWADVAASGLLPGYNWGKGIVLCKRFFQHRP